LECLPSELKTSDVSKLVNILTNKDMKGIEKWEKIRSLLENGKNKMRGIEVIDRIILTYTYPRLDQNVSMLRIHLLKSPFIVHPKTGIYAMI
jgi:DNA primase small subunit